LIIHPGSRNLRIGRASDFYPKEIPNCIARPANAVPDGCDPPVPGRRYSKQDDERASKRAKLDGDVEMDGTAGEQAENDPVSVSDMRGAVADW
jgi:actin-related protein 8